MSFLPPILLHYFITYRCNCKCTFCDIWRSDDLRSNGDARLEDVCRNLMEARKLGARFVDFTGGEPLLHPQLPEMLKQAREVGFKTSVTTNCMLYPQRARELAGRVDYLHFSIDSNDPRQHDAIRRAKAFSRVSESIETAKQLGEAPDLLFTVTEENVASLLPLCELAKKRKLMLILNPVFSHRLRRELNTETLDKLESVANLPFVYLNKAFLRLRRNGGNSTDKPRCRAVTSTIVVSPNNELLLPCFHFAQRRLPIKRSLTQARESVDCKAFESGQGRFAFCEGCTLNCYFDPSFVYKLDGYFCESLAAKAKYAYYKYVHRRLFASRCEGEKAKSFKMGCMT